MEQMRKTEEGKCDVKRNLVGYQKEARPIKKAYKAGNNHYLSQEQETGRVDC
jgi:hypothetical protein